MFFKNHRKRTLCLLTAIIVLCITMLAAYLYRTELFYAARHVDKHYLGEALKDLKARFETDEDWHVASKPRRYNYEWLENADSPIFIAHGLGGRGNANSYAAFEESRALGFGLFELDIFLDNQGYLRCHHGPEAPEPFSGNDCTLPALMERLQDDEFIVLDIKTPFAETAAAIIEQTKEHRHSERLIFQLYFPEQIAIFHQYMELVPLAGPIISVYNSKRSLNHAFRGIQKSGIKAFAFPYPRMPALTEQDQDITLFTFHVKNCRMQKDAFANGIDGIYIRNDLKEKCRKKYQTGK